jgi:hypothetical protein
VSINCLMERELLVTRLVRDYDFCHVKFNG